MNWDFQRVFTFLPEENWIIMHWTILIRTCFSSLTAEVLIKKTIALIISVRIRHFLNYMIVNFFWKQIFCLFDCKFKAIEWCLHKLPLSIVKTENWKSICYMEISNFSYWIIIFVGCWILGFNLKCYTAQYIRLLNSW